MSGWGSSYLGEDQPKKPPLTALSGYEGSRNEYYTQPQDMISYKDRFEEVRTTGNANYGREQDGGIAQLWVFRVVHLTDITLQSYIRRQGIEVLEVQEVSPREAAYKSFLVVVHEKDAPALLQRTFWPGLVSCKYWHEQAGVSKGAALSRRSSAKGNRKSQQHKNVTRASPPKVQHQEYIEIKPTDNNNQRKFHPDGRGQRQNNTPIKRTQKSAKIISSKGRRPDPVVNRRDGNDKHKALSNSNNRNRSNNDTMHHGKDRKKRKEFEEKFNAWESDKPKETTHDYDRGRHMEQGHDTTLKRKADKNKERENLGKDNKRVGNESKGQLNTDLRDKNLKSSRTRQYPATENREEKKFPDQSSTERHKNLKSSRVRHDHIPDNHTEKKLPISTAHGKRQLGDKNRDTRHISSVEKTAKKHANKGETDKRLIGEKNRGARHLSTDHSYSQNREKVPSRGNTHLLPDIHSNNQNNTPASRSNSRDRSKPVSARYTSALPSIHHSRNQRKGGSSTNPPETYPNWVLPLSGLLILSSEEVVFSLLGPNFDGLLGQDIISDDELFLGVKVLAHASRAKSSGENLQRLVYKIWQPHVIRLIKTFTVTVERLYPERAERYFWDLAEFLDLYVSRNVLIDQMASLINICLMEVLALSYKSFLSEEIVKVFRVMQSRVGKS